MKTALAAAICALSIVVVNSTESNLVDDHDKYCHLNATDAFKNRHWRALSPSPRFIVNKDIAQVARLGNALVILSNVIFLAKTFRGCAHFDHSGFLQQSRWCFLQSNRNRSHVIDLFGVYFASTECERTREDVFPLAERRRVLQEHVLPHLVASHRPTMQPTDRLVIHVRGGDIFSKPHPMYTQPPLAFYMQIIESAPFDDVLILSEDTSNPVIAQLVNWRPGIVFQKMDLGSTVATILGAKHLVVAASTFSFYLALMSSEVDRVYLPFCHFWLPSTLHYRHIFDRYSVDESVYGDKVDIRSGKSLFRYPLAGFCYEFYNYTKFNEWTASRGQMDAMLNARMDSVTNFTL